jgi:phage shock protein A
MSSKIEAVEAEATLGEELSGQTAESIAADKKFREMGATTADKTVDDALAELKKKLGG